MAAVTALSEAKLTLLRSYLGAATAQPRVAPSTIAPTASPEPAPLTISQEQLVLRETSRPDIPPLYNECIRLRMLGALNVPALERSLSDVIRRHEIWRTSYVIKNKEVLQFIHPAVHGVELPILDLQGLSSEKQEEEIEGVIGNLVRHPFSLTAGPLLRARLIKLDELEHRLYLIAHLSIVDGLSVYQIFPLELAGLYCAHSSGRSPSLPPVPIQFRDYARWQRQTRQQEDLSKQLDYWDTQLQGDIPPLSWPTDRPRPTRETFRGAILQFVLPKPLAQAMKLLARQESVTVFVTMLSLFATLLHSYTQQDDFVIGTPSPSGRKRSEVQKLLGYFLTPVALRFRLASSMTFRELLRQAQRLTLEAISNDDLPIEVLARELKRTDPSRNPLFTVAISLQPAMARLDLPWSVTSMDINSGGAPWDLYLAFIDAGEGMLGRAQYNPDLFDSRTIARMVQNYQELLHTVSTNADKCLSEIIFPSD
jgi:hypothetical protein